MTAKEEALELVNRFGYSQKSVFPDSVLHAKHGKSDALICVDEILKEIKEIQFNYDISLKDTAIRYWKEVKEEINKL
tara:strand:+ start:763 stop:993 length:231 start_codon:yes stop_codon:yes gene_type:complete